MDGIELVDAVEAHFGIKLDDAETEFVFTVGQLYDLIQEKAASLPDFDLEWDAYLNFIRSQTGSKDDIDRETAFFAEHAKPRGEVG